MIDIDPAPKMRGRWLIAGAREPTPPGARCERCRKEATYVRRDTLVGGGRRRNVYWCGEHDQP